MDVKAFLEKTLKGEYLCERDLVMMIEKAMEIFIEEPNVLYLDSPANVCGDVHGQFYDVRYLFKLGGPVGEKKYLFLGDYVDRGYYSLETITLLFCYKILYPTSIYLLRGNHECRMITTNYGFQTEIMRKFNGSLYIWKLFMEAFDTLPLAAVVDNRIFCVHGGLSPHLPSIDSVDFLYRMQEIPPEGGMADCMWSDPAAGLATTGWECSPRGAGWMFGVDVTNKFLYINELSVVARAHQTAMKGYEEHFGGKVYTVWSAPNYCYKTGNSASIMRVYPDGTHKFDIFEAVPDNERVLPPASFLNPYSF